MSTAWSREIDRATERLVGILEGISADYEINDMEIAKLVEWVNLYDFLRDREPFKSTMSLLARILEDGVVDPAESEELLDWCHAVSDIVRTEGDFESEMIRRFHGLLHGIAIDGIVSDSEVHDMNDWLIDNHDILDIWPASEARKMIEQIISDKMISDDERLTLLDFCNHFIEIPLGAVAIHDTGLYSMACMKTRAPVCQPIAMVCDRSAVIDFKDRHFCFTGPARYGKRRDLENLVAARGGVCHGAISTGLDYLIVGAQSSPAWYYTSYGRKIEKVMNGGCRACTIIFEDDFIEQALV